VPAKPRCLFCYELLHWIKRSDAIYCSSKCRQAAHHASRLNPEVVEKTQITSPPLDYYPVEMDVWEIVWSSRTQCDSCKLFITTGFGMLYYWGDLRWFGCDWPCLRALTEDRELEADI
jgi:hypothetical protein